MLSFFKNYYFNFCYEMSNIVYEYNPRFCQEFSFYLKVKELKLSESAVFELPGVREKGGARNTCMSSYVIANITLAYVYHIHNCKNIVIRFQTPLKWTVPSLNQ